MPRSRRGGQPSPGGGSRALAGASRRRVALLYRGGWHRLAAMSWVPDSKGLGRCLRPPAISVSGPAPLPASSSPSPPTPGAASARCAQAV